MEKSASWTIRLHITHLAHNQTSSCNGNWSKGSNRTMKFYNSMYVNDCESSLLHMYTNTPLINELLQVSIISQEKSVLHQRTYRDDSILTSKFAGCLFMFSKSMVYFHSSIQSVQLEIVFKMLELNESGNIMITGLARCNTISTQATGSQRQKVDYCKQNMIG